MPRELGIGENPARQIAAAAEDDRTQHGHEAAPPTARRRPSRADGASSVCADLGEQFVAHHVVADVDRAQAKPSASVPPWLLMTMPLRPRKTPPFDLRGSILSLQRAERRARQQIAELPDQRAVHARALSNSADLPCGALRGLERDVAGKAFGHHHVDRPLADIVALDEADIVEMRRLTARAGCGRPRAPASSPFTSSTPILRSPTRRPVEAEQHPRHGAAHHGEIDQVLGIGADRGAEVEHDRVAPAASARCAAIAGRSIPAMVSQVEFGHRHQRAGIAGRDRDVGVALLDGVDGEPHRGLPAALAQRLARLVVHLTATSVCTRSEAALSRGRAASSGSIRRGRRTAETRCRDDARATVPRRERPPRAHGHPPWRRARCGLYGAWRDNTASAWGHNRGIALALPAARAFFKGA